MKPTGVATIPTNVKELYKALLIADDDFGRAIEIQNKAQGELDEAKNLGLLDSAKTAKNKLIFIKHDMYYLHLRLTRVFNLLIERQVNFEDN